MTGHEPQRPVLDASDLTFETPGLSAEEIAAATAVILAAASALPATGKQAEDDPHAGWRDSVHRRLRLTLPGRGAWVRQSLL